MTVQKIYSAVLKRIKKIPDIPERIKSNCIWNRRKDFYLPFEAFGCKRNHYTIQKGLSFSNKVKISIVVPLYNTPEVLLKEMIASILFQTYNNWELCLADGSDSEHKYVEILCCDVAKHDARIKYKKLENNYGISANSNECLKMTEGDYIALLDHDDLLHPCALFEVVRSINEKNADFIYTDSAIFNTPKIADILNTDFKPDYSPDYFNSINYICHFSVFKHDLLLQTGTFDSDTDGAQDFDLFLRLSEKAKNIVHIPKCLYYWRASVSSTANGIQSKVYAIEAGKRALINHFKRCGIQADIKCNKNLTYKVDYAVTNNSLVSIILINSDTQQTKTCIESIKQKTTYNNFEIIVVDYNSQNDLFESDVKRIKVEEISNISFIYNFAAESANGDYLVFLACDTIISSKKWIEEMLMFAQRENTGAVGAKLNFDNGKIFNAGIILGINGCSGYSHRNKPVTDNGYSFRASTVQNFSAVTADCMMVSKKTFKKMNGFDTDFESSYYDFDFCLRLRKENYLIVWTPYAELNYRKSGYNKKIQNQSKNDKSIFTKRWIKEITKGDIYYNPNLTLKKEDFSVTGKVFPDAEIPANRIN